MSSEAKTPLRNQNDHWPQRSLFGSNIDSQKEMPNINYKNFFNGKWKKEHLKKSKSANLAENQLLVDIKNQIEEQKAKLKKSQIEYTESKEKALKFNQLDNASSNVQFDVKSIKSQNERPTGIRTFHSTETNPISISTDNVQYQLNGSILDLGHKRPIPNFPETTAKSLVYDTNQLREFNEIQMKYMNVIYPTQEQLTDLYKPKNIRSNSSISSKSSISIDDVPQNIKHRFRTKQANDLMKDQYRVTQTIIKIQSIEDAKKHKKSIDETNYNNSDRPESATIDPKKNALYYDLSNYLRHAVCHGYPDLKKRSFKEHVHNENVNKEYLSEPDNFKLENRRKKDWLGKWTELNVIRERLYKGLEAVNAEKNKKAD